MAKKIFSVIAFVISVVCFAAVGMLTVSLVKECIYVRNLPAPSGIDYLGFMIYPVFYCFTGIPGLVASVVSWKLAFKRWQGRTSFILMILFVAVLLVFGFVWLGR